jgi:SAM-dependent methyltransferase
MTQVFDGYSRYYDLLYRDKDYAGEARFVVDLLCRHGVNTGRILELGCGTGRHAEHLADMGFAVSGVDLSPSMIAAANRRKPAGHADRLAFEQGDVRTARIAGEFNAILSLFHVASYQTTNQDLAAMFGTAAAHLKPGGIFLFDCWFGPAVLTDRPTVRVKRLQDDVVDVLRIAEPAMFPNENAVEVTYTLHITNRSNNQVEQIDETHRMRYFFAPELEQFLAAAGFDLVTMVEWLTGRETGFDTWSATIVAVRR